MHQAVAQVLQFFTYDHLPEGRLRDTSKMCHDLAHEMVSKVGTGPELTVGLRKLLEAKDCFVRAAISDSAAKGEVR